MSLGTRRRARGSRSDLPVNADINVTSLVDVAFTLLVIFIITMPIMQGGIEVSVPKADVQPLTSQERPFYITVTADGTIYMEGSVVTVEALVAGLGQLLRAGDIERVFLRADSLAPFGPVLRAIASAANSGVGWSLVGEPYSGN